MASTGSWVVDQSDVEAYKAEREALKASNPVWYALTGGDKATAYTLDNLKVAKKVTKTADAAATAVNASFDIIAWLKENWQLAIVGVVALLVLLKD